MNEFKAKLHPEWKALVEYIVSAHTYGDTIPHAELAAAADLEPQSRPYFMAIRRAKKALLEDHAFDLEVISRVGYRLIEPKEFHRSMRRWLMLGVRRIRRAVKVAAFAPFHLMTPDEARRLTDDSAKVGRLQSLGVGTIASTRPSLPLSPMPDVPKMLGS